MQNKVFIATSLDGYIADAQGNIDWLNSIPNTEQTDMGYSAFVETIDAWVMGRVTFETVCSFDMEWPIPKPVFVLSNQLTEIPEIYAGKAFLVKGPLKTVLEQIHAQGFHRLYIDGGKTIQSFLQEDLIDEMIITTIPYLLGGGHSLFGNLPQRLAFECKHTTRYLGQVVQSHFVRKR